MTFSQFVRSTGSNLGLQVASELKGSLVGLMGFPGGSVVKNPPTNTGDTGDVCGFRDAVSIPRYRRSARGGNGNPLPIFLSGEPDKQRSLAGYSP